MLEWMSAKVSRMRNRYDHHEHDEEDGEDDESTNSAATNSPIHGATPSTRRDLNDPECLQFMIREKMHRYYARHNILSNDLPFKNLDPCPICMVRFATIQTQPCTHGKICKHCAYRCLHTAVDDIARCSLCYKRIIGFIRLSANPNATCAKDQFIERSFSLRDYRDSCKVNNGFESSSGSL